MSTSQGILSSYLANCKSFLTLIRIVWSNLVNLTSIASSMDSEGIFKFAI